MNVLIVEDDPMVGQLNAAYLARVAGMHLISRCSDVVSALAVLEREAVDLVLLDVYLGRRSGLEIAEWLYAQRPEVDIVLITAAGEPETVRAARRLGVTDYLIKPFTFERFADAIDAARRRRHALSDLAGPIDQRALDALFRTRSRPSLRSDELPKGLTARTLAQVASALLAVPDETFATETVTERTGMSRVSVRKYLRYLVSCDILDETFAYGQIGRPAFAYRCLERRALERLAGIGDD
ncbi:MAG: response regulator [Salinisphaera sp.]|uniref:response regulator n=1 Tax=Salinisphaera sp. TaxID=1914330 RepID=UPI003C7ADD7A